MVERSIFVLQWIAYTCLILILLGERTQSQHTHQTSNLPKWVLCTMARDQLPFMVEWIEFNRLQGAHKIVIYDDGSEDNSLLLQELYHQHGRYYLKMYPSTVLDMDVSDTAENDVRREKQNKAFEHCLLHETQEADWVLVADVDEFIWSPKYDSVSEFLGSTDVDDAWGNIGVQLSTSGMLDDTERYDYKLHREEDGIVQLSNERGLQMLLEDLVRRGPDERMGEPEALIRENTTHCAGGWCKHGPVKSFARKSAVKQLGVHSHNMADGFYTNYANMHIIRGRHFRIRSEADLLHRRQNKRAWDTYTDDELAVQRNSTKTFFSSVNDRSMQAAFTNQVRHHIELLLTNHVERVVPEGVGHPVHQH